MSRVFIDTSAFLALLNRDDEVHRQAAAVWKSLQARESQLVTSSYVLVETYALLGRRFGLEAVRRFRDDFEPLLEVIWVDGKRHRRALDDLLTRERRQLSLVDVVSFDVIRTGNIDQVFAFDRHFDDEGLALL